MKKNIYIIRKYVLASSITEAIKKDKTTQPHDCWLEENAQKRIIDDMSEKKEFLGFK